MPRPTRAQVFKRCVSKLRKHAPPFFPVTVRRGRPLTPKALAECGLERVGGGWRFVIVIRKEARHQEAIDSLLHEWAHALSWSEGHPTLTDHDETWGVCYSKVYRVIWPEEGPKDG